MTIIRFLLAPILGIVVFMFTVGGIEAIGASMYPPPAEISTLTIELTNAAANRDQAALENIQARLEVAMSAYLESAPVITLLFIVFAWVAAAFFGGLAAAGTTPVLRIPMAVFIGIIDVMSIMVVTSQYSHPIWMPVVGVVGAIIMSLLAGMLVARMTRPKAPVTA